MPIMTKNVSEIKNKKIDSYQNTAVVNNSDTMLIINDGSLYSIGAQDLMLYMKDHPDITNHYASKKELIKELHLKLDKTEIGIANGVTPLNADKKVPSEHILFGKTTGTTYQGSDGKSLEDNLTVHTSNFNNPHKITANTINLQNVDNTSDANKPVSIATQTAIAAACSNSNEHSDTSVSNHNISETAHVTKFNQKLDNTSANTFLKDVSYNSESGVFTFTKYDNTTITIDTPMEEVVNSGYYKEDTQELVLILVSGQEIKIPVTGLISEYTGETSASIQVVISADQKITANLIGGGVTRTLLSAELQNSLIEFETLKHSHTNKAVIDGITSAQVATWDNKSSFDGDYNKLTNKPTIPSVYKLPVATTSLGGIKSGTDITVDTSGNVSIVNDSHTHDGRYYTEGEINTKFNDINSNLEECFQSVSNGKTLVASAITGKGISTTSDATFQIMANNITKIQTGGGGKILTFSASGWIDINRDNLGVNVTTNVNCTSVAGWQNFTNSNFTVGLSAATGGVENNSTHKSGVSISSHFYNKSNGILTIILRAYTERYDFSSNTGLTYGCNGFVYVN